MSCNNQCGDTAVINNCHNGCGCGCGSSTFGNWNIWIIIIIIFFVFFNNNSRSCGDCNGCC